MELTYTSLNRSISTTLSPVVSCSGSVQFQSPQSLSLNQNDYNCGQMIDHHHLSNPIQYYSSSSSMTNSMFDHENPDCLNNTSQYCSLENSSFNISQYSSFMTSTPSSSMSILSESLNNSSPASSSSSSLCHNNSRSSSGSNLSQYLMMPTSDPGTSWNNNNKQEQNKDLILIQSHAPAAHLPPHHQTLDYYGLESQNSIIQTANPNNKSNKTKSRKSTPKANKSGSNKPIYKHIPHRDKPVHLVARRNARERRRVQAVNMAFMKLRKCVPVENRNKRLSKVKTLHRAIEYIAALDRLLKSTSDDHSGYHQIQTLESEQQQLRPQQPETIETKHSSSLIAAGQTTIAPHHHQDHHHHYSSNVHHQMIITNRSSDSSSTSQMPIIINNKENYQLLHKTSKRLS